MNNILFTIILLGAFTFVIIWYITKKFRELEMPKGDQGSMQILNQNLQALQHNITSQLHNNNQNINQQLNYASKAISSLSQELGQMQQIGSQLRNFQDFLKSPKLRGNLGEQGLKELLSQALPNKYFDMQYCFRSGCIVDAIIHLEAGKIPVDSKFPMENFNQMLKAGEPEAKAFFRKKFCSDFKIHIDAISKKYINPDEGTADFAFMYLPSESIFFEVINNEQSLFEYAADKHVVISSPSTFFYYLKTIMLGLEGKRITEMSREIIKTLKSIKIESSKFGENLTLLSKHIGNANKTASLLNDSYVKMTSKIDKIDTLEHDQKNLIED